MQMLTVFENVSLDGYFVDAHGAMNWAHETPADAEFDAYVEGNARDGGALVFGRVTYQLMASYWPSEMARAADPIVAERMNDLPKFVFSRTLDRATWNNTTLLSGDPVVEIETLKRLDGPGLAILGSGSLVGPLAAAGLIDELTLVVNPIVLGSGRTLFEAIDPPFKLELTDSRVFANGKVVLSYRPAG